MKLQQQAQANLSGSALIFNLSGQAQIIIGIAATYKSLGDYPSSISYFDSARILLQKAGNRYGEAKVFTQVSLVYDELGDKQKALASLNQALVLQKCE